MDKINAIWATIKADAADTWKRSKMFLLALAGIILAIEFRKLKEFLLVYAGQKEIKSDEKKDQVLAAKEKTANDEADALAKKATQENSDVDWYKK